MPRHFGAGVEVAVVLWQQVDVVEDVAVERSSLASHNEPDVHEGRLVEHFERLPLLDWRTRQMRSVVACCSTGYMGQI